MLARLCARSLDGLQTRVRVLGLPDLGRQPDREFRRRHLFLRLLDELVEKLNELGTIVRIRERSQAILIQIIDEAGERASSRLRGIHVSNFPPIWAVLPTNWPEGGLIVVWPHLKACTEAQTLKRG